ncbi:MAG: hypothetical protein ACJAZW_001870 [Maritalea sp.]|jgi:hypothetical protein
MCPLDIFLFIWRDARILRCRQILVFTLFRSITIELGNYIGIVIFDLKDSLQNDTLTNVRQMATI